MVKDAIVGGLHRAFRSVGIADADVALEFPADLSRGDYATGTPLRYAKSAGFPPRELAERIVAALGAIEGVHKIEIAGPGFINFHLSPEALNSSIESARAPEWGANTRGEGAHVLIEYTSPNLFKPLHIGNLVGNIIGESLARLFSFSGADVKKINYPSDIGLTVAKGVWGIRKLGADASDIIALGEAYRVGNEAYERDEGAKREIDEINRKIYAGDEELNTIRHTGVATSLAHLDALCARLGTEFDLELFESEAGRIGADIVRAHIGDVFEESEGAIVYPGEREGLHTRVFLNSAGLPTYEAKDIGNFKLKTDKYPEWSEYYVVTGVEQKEYFKVVIAAIRRLFPEAAGKTIEHIATGFLTPTTGKMSSRTGNVITGESLLADLERSAQERAKDSRAADPNVLGQEIAVAAIKYQILKQGTGKDIIFDKERALSLEGDSGPYVQYAHARACQIVAKAEADGVQARTDAHADAHDVVRIVRRFPEMVERAQTMREPHIVTTYLTELAGSFNSWYAREQILDGSDKAPHKVALVDAVRCTLRNGLWLLGIPAPEKM